MARNLMKVPTAGGTPSRIASQVHEGRVSPDGRLIAAHRVSGDHEELAIYSADGSLVRVLTGTASGGFQWLPDGSALIARATGSDHVDNLQRIPVDRSSRTVLSNFRRRTASSSSRSILTARIAFSRRTADNDVVLLTLSR